MCPSRANQALHAAARHSLRMPGYPRSLRSLGAPNEFTEIIERDGKWLVAYCPEAGREWRGSHKGSGAKKPRRSNRPHPTRPSR